MNEKKQCQICGRLGNDFVYICPYCSVGISLEPNKHPEITYYSEKDKYTIILEKGL